MNGFPKIMKEMLDHALQWQRREWGGRERERERGQAFARYCLYLKHIIS
jgi:hypothetical protein